MFILKLFKQKNKNATKILAWNRNITMGFRIVTPPLRSKKSRIWGCYYFCQKHRFSKIGGVTINVKFGPNEKGGLLLMSKIFRPRFARCYTRNSRFPLKEHFFRVKTPYFFRGASRRFPEIEGCYY